MNISHKPKAIYPNSKDKGDFLYFAMFLQSTPASCPLVQGEYLKLVHVKCHWDKITGSVCKVGRGRVGCQPWFGVSDEADP